MDVCVCVWKSLSHVRLCDPMDYTLHGIFQARILEWVALLGIEPMSPTLQADSLPAEPEGKTYQGSPKQKESNHKDKSRNQ